MPIVTALIVTWLHLPPGAPTSAQWQEVPVWNIHSTIDGDLPSPSIHYLCQSPNPIPWYKVTVEYPAGNIRLEREAPALGFPVSLACRVDPDQTPTPPPINQCTPVPHVGCWSATCTEFGLEYTPCPPLESSSP